MALSSAKHEKFYATSGGGANEVSSKDLTNIEATWDLDKASGCAEYMIDPFLGPIIFQLQQIQDEIDYLRTEISSNKDKTGISSGQTSAITANTAKVSLVGGSATALSFGEMITTSVKGKSSYSIVMTAVKSGVTKTVTLTLT